MSEDIQPYRIYTKRFPKLDPEEDPARRSPHDPPTAEERAKTEAAWKEFLHSITEPRPVRTTSRAEEGRLFIQRVKELAERYEIALDIFQSKRHVYADFHLPYGVGCTSLTRRLAELIGMCDNLCFAPSTVEHNDLTLSLEFRTRAV